MTIKLTDGTYETRGGVPRPITGLAEALQNAALRIRCKKGSFRYAPQYGSSLHTLDYGMDHAEEQAAALANEALLGTGGVRVRRAVIAENTITFTVETPYGVGEVTYGDV